MLSSVITTFSPPQWFWQVNASE